jgi:hypothetical protein
MGRAAFIGWKSILATEEDRASVPIMQDENSKVLKRV